MSKRYTKLFSLPENLYSAGSPVMIAAGALLKDNQTGRVLAQLKLENISAKEIAAVKVTVTAFDISGKELVCVPEFQYLDLSAKRDSTFGQKQAIPLPDSVTRSIDVKCTSVIFSDGTTWDAPDAAHWRSLPKQELLTDKLKELAPQYQRDTTEKAQLVPTDYEDLWLCFCGAINHGDESLCHSCQSEKTALLAALDRDALTEHKAAYDQVEAEKAAKKVAEEKAKKAHAMARAKKIGIITAITAGVIIAVSMLAVLVTKVILPSSNYRKALSLMESGKYEEAIVVFDAIGDYKDSGKKIEECILLKKNADFQKAESLMIDGDYDVAIVAFEALGDYKEASSKVEECNMLKKEKAIEDSYQNAINLLNNEDYEEALSAFKKLEDYKDSKDKAVEAETGLKTITYSEAIVMLNNHEYDNAISAFEELQDFQDSKEKLAEAKYAKAESFESPGKIEEAYTVFADISSYNDAKSRAQTLANQLGDDYLADEDLVSAVEWYQHAENWDKMYATEYEYVKEHFNNEDATTYTFLKNLKEANYENAVSDYATLYTVSIQVVVNSDKDDHTNNVSPVKLGYRYDDHAYAHIRVVGRYPGQALRLKLECATKASLDQDFWLPDVFFSECNGNITINDNDCHDFVLTWNNFTQHGQAKLTIINMDTGELLSEIIVDIIKN